MLYASQQVPVFVADAPLVRWRGRRGGVRIEKFDVCFRCVF